MFVVLGISRSFGILETKPNSPTMKSIIFALALVAIAAAGPVPVEKEPTQILRSEFEKEPIQILRSEFEKEPIQILRSEFDQSPEGSYIYGFESEDGISRSESGDLKEVLDEENKPHSVVVVKGTYSFTNDLGKVDTVKYWADETGFHAEGDSIPKPVEPVSRR